MIHQEFDQVESTTKNIPWNQPRNIGKKAVCYQLKVTGKS